MSTSREADAVPTDRSSPPDEMHRDFIDALVGATIGGRYVVTRLLGQGAMGAVFAARHSELEQNVAIKFMFPEFASNRIYSARFAREAKLAAKVQSPHLVRVFDVGRIESGVPYLVMERLTGRDLAAELEERGRLPVAEAVDLALQVATGVGELHGLGYVHRDLKPSNLFVADVAGTRTLKILDFGISKEAPSTSSALTSTESMLGTPSYMSPEQIKNSKDVDPRSDLWSLGVILYELVTGRLPFETSSNGVGELFGIILFKDATPPRAHRPDLPQAFERVVLRCLQRDPADRYRDVVELAEALRPFAGTVAAGSFPRRPGPAAATTPEASHLDLGAASAAVSAVGASAVAEPLARRRAEGTFNAASSTRSLEGLPTTSRRLYWVGLGIGGCLLAVAGIGASMRPHAEAPGASGAAAAMLPSTAPTELPGAARPPIPSATLAPLGGPAIDAPGTGAAGAPREVTTSVRPGGPAPAGSSESRAHPVHPSGAATHAASPAHVQTPPVTPPPAPPPPAATGAGELILDRK
jgi:eukaryotic-like serine/threonine-protein kinase